MRFCTHLPPPALRPFVASAHGYDVPANPTGVHRGLPSRHVTLVIEVSGPMRVSGRSSQVAAHGVVGGLHTRPVLIDASKPQEGLQYALSPLASEALLGVSNGEIADRVVDLADLFGAAAHELIDAVAGTGDWGERFRLVDEALLRFVERPPSPEAAIDEAWRWVFAHGGQVRVADLADRIGYSRRHLSERFRLATGVTPKQAARIARFEAARAMMVRPQRPTLAGVAVACGYADQAHLARDWKQLAGCSVTTWLREELPFVQDAVAPAGGSSDP